MSKYFCWLFVVVSLSTRLFSIVNALLCALLSVYGKLTALLDFVSEGRGFSFIQRTQRSLSTSRIPYLWVSEKRHRQNLSCSVACHVRVKMCDSECTHRHHWTMYMLQNSPSSLHWYESTKQLSSFFAWWSENFSLTSRRLKSSLKRVSLFRVGKRVCQESGPNPSLHGSIDTLWV